jgi:hypothetical protein
MHLPSADDTAPARTSPPDDSASDTDDDDERLLTWAEVRRELRCIGDSDESSDGSREERYEEDVETRGDILANEDEQVERESCIRLRFCGRQSQG